MPKTSHKTGSQKPGLRILFVTRKYPPTLGGMETAAYELHQALAAKHRLKLVKWTQSDRLISLKLARELITALLYPVFMLRSLWAAVVWRPDIIYLQDGVLAPVGGLLRLISRRPTIVTIHGLDITYNNRLYQMVFRWAAIHNSKLVAVSQASRDEAVARTGRPDVAVINNGVNDQFYLDQPRTELIARLAQRTGLDPRQLSAAGLLLSHGRLVKRKGVAWFITKVMPGLVQANPSIVYLVSGDGPEMPRLRQAVNDKHLGRNVKLLGRVSDGVRRLLYNAADLFIMPNIPVAGDPEGFGIVAIEASVTGLPVLASRLGGVSEAVVDGRTGYLMPAQAAVAWQSKVSAELIKPNLKRPAVRTETLKRFSWTKAADQYSEIMRGLIKE